MKTGRSIHATDARGAAPPRGRGVAWLCVSLWLAGAGSLSGQAPTGPTQNAASGARVFGVKGCGGCHAVNGLGPSVGPDLGGIEERRSFYDLAAVMWNHLPPMRARMAEFGVSRPELSGKEAGDLMAFLFTLDYFDSSGDPERGRLMFAEKNCVRCHQVRGSGGVIGPNLDFLSQYSSPMFVAAAMWKHGPGMSQTMRALGIQRAVFTGADFRDLMAFLRSVSEQPAEGAMYVLPGRSDVGRQLFTSKGCLYCHGARGAGGPIGPPLRGRGLRWSTSDFVAELWNKAPAMQVAMRGADIQVPELSASEMADLVAYLYSVDYFGETGRAARGRQSIAQRGCLECHSLSGRGGTSASDLGTTNLVSATEVVAALWSHPVDLAGAAAEWPTLTASQMADLVAFLRLAP